MMDEREEKTEHRRQETGELNIEYPMSNVDF
jgi:hypothetical protein